MRKFYHYFVVLSLLLLAACGQKGPLYLEDKSETVEQTTATTEKITEQNANKATIEGQ